MPTGGEHAIRQEIARRLGRADVPDAMWDAVRDPVEFERIEAAKGDERRRLLAELASLVAETAERACRAAAEWLGEQHAQTRHGGEHERDVRRIDRPAPSTPVHWYELNRAWAFSLGLATLAESADKQGDNSDHPRRSRVHRFRDRHLGGETLSPSDARSFLRSPAARYLWWSDLESRNAPPLIESHLPRPIWSEPDREETGLVRWEAEIVLGPTGEVLRRRHRHAFHEAFPRELRVPPDDGGDFEVIDYWPGSRIDQLGSLAGWLAELFPWKIGAAALFVLTGVPPRVEAIEGTYERKSGPGWSRETVTLTVEPWVPAESVKRMYEGAQRESLGGMLGRGTPIRRRDKALAVWLFSQEQEVRAGHPIAIRKLLNLWNDAHPDDRYKDHSGFFEARRRGEEFARKVIGLGGAPEAPVASIPEWMWDAVPWEHAKEGERS